MTTPMTDMAELLRAAGLYAMQEWLGEIGAVTQVGDHVHVTVDQGRILVGILAVNAQGNRYSQDTPYGKNNCPICDSQCDTCRDGCECGDPGTGCGHSGCWGGNADGSCPEAKRLKALRDAGPVGPARYGRI
jgi:hypothetical protein